MAKNPAFPFYAQDYLVDTMRWSREMKSLHIDLLAESWVNGALVDNHGSTTVQPSFPMGLNSQDQNTWMLIKDKWIFADGFWTNPKLETARKDREAYILKQSERGKKSALKRKKELNRGSTVVQPIEREREEEKEDVFVLEGGAGGIDLGLNENMQAIRDSHTLKADYLKNHKYTEDTYLEMLDDFEANCREKEWKGDLRELKFYLSNFNRSWKQKRKENENGKSKSQQYAQNASDLNNLLHGADAILNGQVDTNR